LDVPGIPMNISLEKAVLPDADKVSRMLEQILKS
jgi:hypothetical protein